MRISDWSSDVCSSDLDTDDTGEIAGQHVQGHLGGDVRKPLHQKVRRPHPGLDGAERMLDCFEPASHPVVGGHRLGQGDRDVRFRAGQDLSAVEVATVSNDLEAFRSEENTYEIQSLMRISYAALCLK